MAESAELRRLLEGANEILIVCHNNPDPDCLASALALGRIARHVGIDECHILFSGQISHQQNRAFVNLLEIDLQPFDPAAVKDRDADSLVAFVDHAVPGENNDVPEGTPIDIVIDHHPAESVDARFVDHRVEAGATATILAEYVADLAIDVDATLATALLFAIRRETLGFLRGVTRAEYEAAAVLHDYVDTDLLRQLTNPSISGATVDAIADAIDNRIVRGSVLITHVGRTTERDALPQAVDYLAPLEGVETAVVFGIIDDAVHLSARSNDPRIHIGDVLRSAFSDVGSCGGHREMAGGQVPLGIFAEFSEDEQLIDMVEQVITTRVLAELNLEESGDGPADGQ